MSRPRFRSGRVVRLVLVVATVALVVALGASSVQTWVEQRDQTAEARRIADELDGRVAELELEITQRTSSEGARREALCFGPYVEPGVEVYAVPGVGGCVTGG